MDEDWTIGMNTAYESIRKIPDKNIIHIFVAWICGTYFATHTHNIQNHIHKHPTHDDVDDDQNGVRDVWKPNPNWLLSWGTKTEKYMYRVLWMKYESKYSLKHIIASCGIVID